MSFEFALLRNCRSKPSQNKQRISNKESSRNSPKLESKAQTNEMNYRRIINSLHLKSAQRKLCVYCGERPAKTNQRARQFRAFALASSRQSFERKKRRAKRSSWNNLRTAHQSCAQLASHPKTQSSPRRSSDLLRVEFCSCKCQRLFVLQIEFRCATTRLRANKAALFAELCNSASRLTSAVWRPIAARLRNDGRRRAPQSFEPSKLLLLNFGASFLANAHCELSKQRLNKR